ncbi:MAG: ribulose-phosphate 3-epimerase [Chloroflexi bacterium]|nr:ribulose-phosphate 3-epimerase [Chloroflexota bacterium]
MSDTPSVKIAPSILSADFARLGEQVAEATAAGADYIHVDIMDGRFVPNITIGPMVVEAVRRCTHLPMDVHLMVMEPERVIPAFARAGATILTVHAEACTHLHRVVHQIKEHGARAGVAINPATSPTAVEEVLADLDLVLVMTVNPGFPAQEFIAGVLDKVRRVRRKLDDLGAKAELEVDGGIKSRNAAEAVRAGARVLVAGSAIFASEGGVREAMKEMRASLSKLPS